LLYNLMQITKMLTCEKITNNAGINV
jgi:hypothetical protein